MLCLELVSMEKCECKSPKPFVAVVPAPLCEQNLYALQSNWVPGVPRLSLWDACCTPYLSRQHILGETRRSFTVCAPDSAAQSLCAISLNN